MVRVKAKARKGDEAFQTRKQKVGRKKLAPATATRAEVHARTLRVTTPLSIVHAKTDEASVMAAERGGRSRQQRHHQEKGKEGVPAVSAEKLHRDFKEQLSNTRHYKKAMRGAGFMSLVRAIEANYEFIDAATQSSSRVSFSDLSDERFLTPLEILSAFTSALDAMCDTDSDVRSAALATIKIILQPPSSHSSYSSLSPSRGCGVEAGGVRLDGPAVAVGGSSPMTCNVDRVRAVLSVVDVTLTHAMVSVRRDGVELLHLILQVSPSDVRAVLSESDAWVKMASRVSSLLLQGSIAGSNSSGAVKTVKLIHVVPAFLETMLLQQDSVDNVLVGEGSGGGGGGGFSHVQKGEKDVNNTEVSAALICELFEECSPKWSMEWKELMEMRSAIFRDADRVQRATAIARAFACVSMYLRERRLLNKSKVKLIRHLFTVKMPFTMQELTLAAAAAASASSDSFGGNNNNNNKSSNSRMELANAIADACLPISDSANDVSQLIRDFLSTSLSGRNINGGGGSNNKVGAMQLLGPLRTLRTALIKFPTTLLPRLLFLAQPMMQTVTRAVDIKGDSTWVEAALLAADVLAVTLTSQAAVTSKQCLSFLRAAVLSVPRLLFSIRGKADAAMVDRTVWAFLQILWRLVSSGHPLMLQTSTSSSFSTTTTTTTTNNNNNNNNKTADGDSTTAQLVLSLPSLFEIRVPDAATPGAYISLDGALARCTGRTRELAAHLLFYLQAAVPCTDATPVVHTSLADTLPC